jgi:hypothetical protein
MLSVFMLYSVVLGLAIGFASGGRLARLAEVRVRGAWIAFAGLTVQIALFSSPLAEVVGEAGPPIYVASMVAVIAVVLRNVAVPGLPVIALGAASNLIAIVANGGFMPAAPDALAALGKQIGGGFTNSAQPASVALAPLTDVFAMPAWAPFANVFSVGDVLIGVGVVIALVAVMRDRRLDPPLAPTPALVAGVPVNPVRGAS